MKFGIEFVPYIPPAKLVDLVRKSEEVGFDYCWITDHYNNRNVFSVLTAIAQATEHIKLGPGVTNPYLLHPASIASAIATVDEISGGRAVLGLSAGDRTILGSLGVPLSRPLATIREAVELIRKLLRGERVDFEGERFRLKGARLNFRPKGEIPVYLGAQGPKMLELAGELADGVLVNASHPEDIASAVGKIKEGAERAGKKLEEVEVAAYTSFSVSSSSPEAKKAAMPVVAFIVASAPEVVLQRHGISLSSASEIKKLISSGKIGEAVSRVDERMLEAFCIFGTPRECVEKIEGVRKTGVTQFVVGSPVGPDIPVSLDLIRREVIPLFR